MAKEHLWDQGIITLAGSESHKMSNKEKMALHSPNVASPDTTVTYFFLFLCALAMVTFFGTV